MSEQVKEIAPKKGVSSNGKQDLSSNGKQDLSNNGQVNEEAEDNSVSSNLEPEEAEIVETAPTKKRRLPIFIVGGVLLIAAISGVIYWLYARQFESTDDAFIEGKIVQVSPKVSAYVAKVYVKENQQVHKGDLLVELDSKDYEAKLEQAKAQLQAAQAQRGQAQSNVNLTRKTTNASQNQARSNIETAQSNVEQTRLAADSKQSLIRQAQSAVKTAQANLAQTKTQVPQAEANLRLAQAEFNRRQTLFNQGDISKQSLDQATTTLQTMQAQLNAAQRQVDLETSSSSEYRCFTTSETSTA